jgi:Uncharacterised nucleotidyltransferase
MSALDDDARSARLWAGVDSLLGRATVPGVLAHKLGPLAAQRLRRLGEPVPPVLQQEQRGATLANLAAGRLVERIRATVDGPFVLIKGPEVAHFYPERARRFRDIDILTAHAEPHQRALLESGFVEVEEPDLLIPEHHLPPLRWPAVALEVEVHTVPNWPPSAGEPPLAEILEAAVPSASAVDGVLAPTPAHHALILASHAWVHEPLRTLRDLLDIAALAAQADERELDRTADAWGIGRLWRTTSDAIEALFFGGRRTFPLRSWARHLEPVRERTRFESYLEWLGHGFWEVPAYKAPVETLRALRSLVSPAAGESWGQKLKRAPHALRALRAPLKREGREP